MRTATLVVLLLTFALAPSGGSAKECPSSALKASNSIWPFGAIPTGQTRTARHPCGKRITCIGGKMDRPKILRQCHWD